MARRILSRLTASEVVRLSKVPGRHPDGGGLYLHVSPAGVPSWVFRYMIEGRERNMGLGPLHAVTLKGARERAARCRELRHAEVPKDPLEERRAARLADKLTRAKTLTFAECARAYIAAHSPGWRNPKHRAQWSSTLETYAYPHLGDLSVEAVDVGLVMRVLEPIWTTKSETAGRVRGRIENVLDWATTRGYRAGENPARWKGRIENLLPKKSKVARVTHHAALPYDELPAFMAELRAIDGIAARALEFTILTASRTGEVIGARWDEFDLKARVWTVKGERMKAGKEHRVPLSDRAAAILDELARVRSGEFVFPGATGSRPLSNMAMTMLLRRMNRADVMTVHGARSTFSDWCAERTAFPSEVREMALAHTQTSAVERAYRRGDLFEKRRQLADAWSRFCTSPAAGEVVPLRRAAE
jgi:integrase